MSDPIPDWMIGLAAEQPLKGRRVLIIVENLPVPFDRRVWAEARTLRTAGARVSVICPSGHGYEARRETIDGIDIYRHPLPLEASGAAGYLLEYGTALWWEFRLALTVWRRQGIDVIHGCNPPDLIFLVALPFRLLGIRYLFDHHDLNPELYEAKFSRRGFFWRLMGMLERVTFQCADVSIATNESYRKIAVERGGMDPKNVFVVRSGPDIDRLVPVAPNPDWRNGRRYMVGYVGVMGDQEGIDLLLGSVAYLVEVRKRDDIQFVLVGGGSSLEKLKKMADTMAISPYLTFTGRAPDPVLFEVLSTADICVNPDRVNEMNDKSTMNKILEYMAFSKPIVQFELAEGRYSAQGASLYAEPNDVVDLAAKIENLLDDPLLRKEMGKIGRERLEQHFTWPRQVPSLIAAYERVLQGMPARHRSVNGASGEDGAKTALGDTT